MRRSDIAARFDEIVAFAEVERFLDTPVKHYSDGMYLRLAFAVAAHLEPEILLVDEVLAVGDARFQRKCLGKMSDIAEREGRTVAVVSHNMGVIQRLCDRSLLMEGGRLVDFGPTAAIVSRYLGNDVSAVARVRSSMFRRLRGAERARRASSRSATRAATPTPATSRSRTARSSSRWSSRPPNGGPCRASASSSRPQRDQAGERGHPGHGVDSSSSRAGAPWSCPSISCTSTRVSTT